MSSVYLHTCIPIYPFQWPIFIRTSCNALTFRGEIRLTHSVIHSARDSRIAFTVLNTSVQLLTTEESVCKPLFIWTSCNALSFRGEIRLTHSARDLHLAFMYKTQVSESVCLCLACTYIHAYPFIRFSGRFSFERAVMQISSKQPLKITVFVICT